MVAEITTSMVRGCVTRLSNAVAVQQQYRPGEIIGSVYRHANDRGHGLFNPAADIKPSSIAIFKPRGPNTTPGEIGLFFRTLDRIGAMGTMKMT